MIPVVKFAYPDNTREEDKVSKRLLDVHFTIGSLFHACGGAERLQEDLEEEEEAPPVPSTAPVGPLAQERWNEELHQRLRRVSRVDEENRYLLGD